MDELNANFIDDTLVTFNSEDIDPIFENDVDSHSENNFCWIPIQETALEGNLEVTELLLENLEDVKIKDNNAMSALYKAVWNGNLDMAKLLLENGADVNAKDTDGWTLLYSAAGREDIEMAKLLLENGGHAYHILMSFACFAAGIMYALQTTFLSDDNNPPMNNNPLQPIINNAVLLNAIMNQNINFVHAIMAIQNQRDTTTTPE